MRVFLSFISFLMVAALLAGACAFAWGWSRYTAPGPLAEQGFLVVEKGQGVSSIAGELADRKIMEVEDELLFRIAARLGKVHTKLKAGEYEFPAHISMRDVLGKLSRGEIYQRRITVREGLTSWQVVNLLNDVHELSGDRISEIPPEGALLPETYSYVSGDMRQAKLDDMKNAMSDSIYELWRARDETIPVLSEAEAVILASIVEKETGVAAERARIAGVFENRLRRGIPLQSDPTVIYAITGGKIQDNGMGPLGRRLLRDDLDFASPYNTYKNPGLPPGPICNPGRDSIKAVLNPENHNYLYFVADGTGGHVFAETLDEHNRNVEKWRKLRNEQGRDIAGAP